MSRFSVDVGFLRKEKEWNDVGKNHEEQASCHRRKCNWPYLSISRDSKEAGREGILLLLVGNRRLSAATQRGGMEES
jgi:hypothetical protein